MAQEAWQVSPRPNEQRRFSWTGGTFETARRTRTASVEGAIRPTQHIIMVTLRGGARRHEFVTDSGSRYVGRDRAGSVSFLPAGCERRLRLEDVAWEWASIAVPPAATMWDGLGAFHVERDLFLFGLLAEFERLLSLDGGLDPLYCEAMTLAVISYVDRRYARSQVPTPSPAGLTARQLRVIDDYIAARLEGQLRVSDLAQLVDLSAGHFHRAFRATTGRTPLHRINEIRIDQAERILREEEVSVVEAALRVGFVSPSHFARVFRDILGLNPSAYRNQLAVPGGKRS